MIESQGRAAKVALGTVLVLLAATMIAAGARVRALQSSELAADGDWRRLGDARNGAPLRLLEASLGDGDEVTLELCSSDRMEGPAWIGGRAALVRTDRAEEMFGLRIDQRALERARRSERGGCLMFAFVEELQLGEPRVPIAIELSWTHVPDVLAEVSVHARALARRALVSTDKALVLGLWTLALSLVLALALVPRPSDRDGAGAGVPRAILGLVIVLGSGMILGMIARGAVGGLVAGLVLAAIEIAASLALIRPQRLGGRLAVLGMARESSNVRPFLAALVGAPIAGFGLFFVAQISLAMIPSTGQAPVESFVRMPSGMLSFAALAVVAPIAEEFFFRGLIYGLLRGSSESIGRTVLAIVGAWLIFAIAHVPQDWGNWGGLVAVLIAGLGFTLLRAFTGSTAVACGAHLVYNGLLAIGAVDSVIGS